MTVHPLGTVTKETAKKKRLRGAESNRNLILAPIFISFVLKIDLTAYSCAHRCPLGKCLDEKDLCNGIPNCRDRSDEQASCTHPIGDIISKGIIPRAI
jgi:Low-density lipoprotein receptor domain class A